MAYGGRIKLWREPDENGDFEPLTEKQLKRITSRAMNYCLWSVNNSSKTEKQLVDKMRQKHCPEDIIESTIADLKDRNLIDDISYAKFFISSKKNMKWGDSRISRELSRKGISEEDSRALFEESEEDPNEESEEDRARQFAERKMRSTKQLDRKKRVDRTVGAMARRGFPIGISYQIINELMEAETLEAEALESEINED